MRLLIIRHADAGDREAWAKSRRPDDERPLSQKGHEQTRSALKGLLSLLPSADAIASSPYVRARETAEIVREGFGLKTLAVTTTLEPDADPADFESWVREQPKHDAIVVVGHEPHLGLLATWLTCGSDSPSIDLKKGGACMIEFRNRPKRGAGSLRWLMGPKELAAIGRS